MEDDKEKEDLKQCFKIVQDDEVEIDAIPLATKPAPIVNFQIHRKERQGYYKIIRADGSSKIYLLFSQLIKSFDREDLETLTDLIWRKLQGKKVMLWRLYDSCGIHFVRFKDIHVYMLVEKRYPLTPATITDMLNKKLKSDYWNEICYQLLKLITKKLKNQLSGRIIGIKRLLDDLEVTAAKAQIRDIFLNGYGVYDVRTIYQKIMRPYKKDRPSEGGLGNPALKNGVHGKGVG
ncbi:hypothetical protein Tco_1392725 [Tanacetum coccineum]